MLKILTAGQIKQLDAHTIASEPITSIDLMERASRAFVNWFIHRFDSTQKTGIVCGTGNNGGDGLAIARLLHEWNYSVKIWIVRGVVSESSDFKINLERIKDDLEIFEIVTELDKNLFTGCDVLVDAIFGSGLSRPVEGIYEQAITCINQTNAIRVAVDIPSGLMADKVSFGVIVHAHFTVSFQLPKLAFLLPQNHQAVGDWRVVRIGLDKKFISETTTEYFYIEKSDVRSRITTRNKFDHKGTYGKALLIVGSYGKMGAAILAARATMRTGIGLLTTHVPGCGYQIMQMSVPESMVSIDNSTDRISSLPYLNEYDSIGIGPGLGQFSESKQALHELLQNAVQPLVLDADALNLIATNRELLQLLPKDSILTPHPGEFARLAGEWRNDFDKLVLQKEFSKRTSCIVIVKGAYTSIATPEGKIYFNSTGNPGMATAGSGDVLTGILTSLLGQGYPAFDSALVGVYLHGLAGDLAAKETGEHGLIASDIIDYLSKAYLNLR